MGQIRILIHMTTTTSRRPARPATEAPGLDLPQGPNSPDEEQLIRSHLPLAYRLVAEVAARTPRHVPREDLTSAALVGLAQAARNYDAARGVPFLRYAATRIRGAILDELRTLDWASRPVRAKARLMEAANEKLVAALGRTPTPEELAAEMGLPIGVVQSLSEDLHRAVVLNYDAMNVNGEADGMLPSAVDADPEMELLDRERNAYLVDAVRALPDRLRVVVVGYFLENRSMQDIGDELGVSESRISQMRAEALDLLRDGINSQLEPEAVVECKRPDGRVARRKAAYYAAIAASSTTFERIGSAPRPERRTPVSA